MCGSYRVKIYQFTEYVVILQFLISLSKPLQNNRIPYSVSVLCIPRTSLVGTLGPLV